MDGLKEDASQPSMVGTDRVSILGDNSCYDDSWFAQLLEQLDDIEDTDVNSLAESTDSIEGNKMIKLNELIAEVTEHLSTIAERAAENIEYSETAENILNKVLAIIESDGYKD